VECRQFRLKVTALCFRGKKEEGRRKREEGRGKKEEGRRKREEGRGKKEEGRRKREEGRGKKEEGRKFSQYLARIAHKTCSM